ncbi:ribonuclease Z [Sulfurisphaera tokodaii]|uniref:Ribonuclease Z n=2 Tax=Sulfurisphaera tokodaii TaxID=111955 RepID=RNZ_SULTO|nr:ribonuclease Z [Sulfurisphaera tokodaii]Q973F1.1 RecName: Full=Ribonuclease Z; Short=RNase Z; AltName: Full=tRNA 3 endonuclease; AltName: Full=tRNase Z [Sulfurisphaera tokodaii str. 7]BAK54420.1 ribonuclease Z [Sulfurisphaera tokodaii str. 7]HII73922.1 ribonuclease Z [Sulfurisphaera tokodaii]
MITVYFIGTGGGAPNKRGLPAIMVRREGFDALFDCGEGTQWRMMEHNLSFMKIKLIGITHMHGDHVLGLPGMIETMGMYSRKESLLLMGPKELKEFLEDIFKKTYFYPNFEIQIIDKYEDENIKISTFETCHTIESQGYLFEEKDRLKIDIDKLRKEGIKDWRIIRMLKEGKRVEINGKVLLPEDYLIVKKGIRIAYTGDTGPCEKVINAVKDVDLLIHDSTFIDEKEAYKYGHSNSYDAAYVALKANVKRLALFHISPRYDDTYEMLIKAKRIFEKTFVAEPLSYYIIRQKE